MRASLSRRAAIAGVGTTAWGSFPELSEEALAARAFAAALQDCGLEKKQIDGLVTCRLPSYVRTAATLGLDPRWTLQVPAHGRMSGMAIIEAMMAIECGAADHVALLYANVGRSRRVQYGGDEMSGFWDPWGFTSPGAAHALMFRLHMERYGTTTRQLGEVAVAFRQHAALNPEAVMKTPFDLDAHAAARPIVAPLGLLDYCLINDGAVCLILTSAQRARDLAQPAVLIAGAGARDALAANTIASFHREFWYEELHAAAQESFAMAGLGHDDVDALMTYDNFTPTVLFSLEGLGYCERGESGSFVENGALALGGRLPTNTDGGHLSNSYMQGWALNVEAVRQLRGQAGSRQVPDCRVVHYASATPCCRSILYALD
jgi:acetyl-CoA acetyltransferase